MADKRTPGLLAVNPIRPDQICTADGSLEIAVATMHSVATSASNARRIVACVNACEGISTEELEGIAKTGGMLGPREDVARTAKQRDELLAALKLVEDFFSGPTAWTISQEDEFIEKISSAITRVTGEQS